eukprot:gene27674-7315_t
MKPSLLDIVFGLVLGVPGTSGFARVFAQDSHARKEGMLEFSVYGLGLLASGTGGFARVFVQDSHTSKEGMLEFRLFCKRG